MEAKNVRIEMDCSHDQASGTMTCSWLDGKVQIVVDWKQAMAVVLVRGEIRRRFSIAEMSIEEFMRIEAQTQEAAEQLARFDEAA